MTISRRTFVKAGTALPAIAAFATRPATSQTAKKTLVVGLATEAVSFTPLYVANDRIWKTQGIDGELIGFRGDAEAAQALAGGSIDISVQSLDMLINLIGSGQPVMGFYAGAYMSDYAWLSQPSIKRWSDLKGKAMGISTLASQGSLLTQYELQQHGLEPMKDVQFMQVGTPGQGAYQALQAGRIAATILSPPTRWMAAAAGFNVLGTQARDIAAQWPKLVFIASKKNIEEQPDLIKSFLRSYVAAIRFARSNRAATIDILQNRLKFDKESLGRTYDEFMPNYNERGLLPQDKYMKIYWDFQIQNKFVTEAWPKTKYLDSRFIDSFASWA
jgi:ABC-type nitrate/sulfonate/bicarbonate transport system substrate-binding protein